MTTALRISYFTIDPERLTIAELTRGDEAPWSFLVFEDQPSDLEQLDDRLVLARGKGDYVSRGPKAFAIFDTVERRRILEVRSADAQRLKWAFAPRRGAVFVADTNGEPIPGMIEGKKLNSLLELPLDGSPARVHLIANDFHIHEMAERDDGRLVCLSPRRMALFDPRAGSAELIDYPWPKSRYIGGPAGWKTWPRGLSPDGRLMLRAHLGSIPRSDGTETDHPDLVADGQPSYGVALDIYETGPVKLRRRVIVKYVRSTKQNAQLLNELSDMQDHRTWDGVSQLPYFAPLSEPIDRSLLDALMKKDEMLTDALRKVDVVRWDADSRGFWACYWHEEMRHVSIDGEVGAPVPSDVPGRPSGPPLPSEAALKRIRKEIRAKSVQRIAIPDLTTASLLQACEEMAQRMEHGLDTVIFRDTITFKIAAKAGGAPGPLNEAAFFDRVGDLDPEHAAPLVPPLRRLITSFTTQARHHACTASYCITSGGPPERSRAALSGAAVALARLDPRSFEVLRGWFYGVDQEHDGFAANTVFPAIVRRAGLSTPETVRFALWFCMYQWQTLRYSMHDLGVIDAFSSRWSPREFVQIAIEEARSFEQAWGPDKGIEKSIIRNAEAKGQRAEEALLGSRIDRLRVDHLSESLPWERAVLDELDRLFGPLD